MNTPLHVHVAAFSEPSSSHIQESRKIKFNTYKQVPPVLDLNPVTNPRSTKYQKPLS